MIAPTNQPNNEEKELIRLISEVIQGYSTIRWRKKTLYIKHHTLSQHAHILLDTEERKAEAQARGIPTEEQALAEAIERGDWTKEDEEYIKKTLEKIDALARAADQLKITAQKKAQYAAIEELRKTIREKNEIRNIFLTNTAEVIANTTAYNEFLSELLYMDNKFTKKVDDIDSIEIRDFVELRHLQNVAYLKFNDLSLAKAALSDFFKPIMQFCDDPYKVFGCSISEMSMFQMKLLSYGYMFNSIFKNVSDIPDFIKKDPEALVEFVNQRDAGEKVSRKTAGTAKQGAGATTFFGASQDDIQKLKGSDERVVDFNEELKKRGGSMNMREMMELCGVE